MQPLLQWTAVSITYFDYVASLVLSHFSTLSHKWHHLKKKEVNEYKMCVTFSLQLFSKTFLILRRNEQDMIINV
jgi:hypothetical protein